MLYVATLSIPSRYWSARLAVEADSESDARQQAYLSQITLGEITGLAVKVGPVEPWKEGA